MTVQIRVLIVVIVTILITSTIFFHIVEGWDWVDSYFFTVITISTVGYGQLVPVTVIGKLATTVLIFFGIGVVAAALSVFGARLVNNRVEKIERKNKSPTEKD